MRTRNSVRILMIVVSMLSCSLPGSAQQQQQQQNESLWQKIKKSAKQTGQNAAQQGTQQVQQVQQQIPIVGGQGQANQMAPQSPCGSLGAPGNGTLVNTNYTGGPGGGVGSCGPNCFDAGPFAAAVTQMTMSQQGYWHIIRMNVQFRNATNQPLIIAYHDGSMVMVDNLGNTYQAAGGNPGAVQGMGIDRGNQTDSQFALAPGQTGNVMFSVARSRWNDSAIGTGFAYNFTIDELQAQNGAQAIPVRQYNLNFPSLAAGASSTGFPAQGTSPAPAGYVATGGGKGAAISAATGYDAGAAAPAGVSSGQAPGAVAGSAPVVQGTTSPTANPRAQRAQRRPAMQAPVATLQPQPATAPAVNTALRSTGTTQAKPAVPAKPIPAKATSTKTAKTNAATTTNSK